MSFTGPDVSNLATFKVARLLKFAEYTSPDLAAGDVSHEYVLLRRLVSYFNIKVLQIFKGWI